MLTMHAWPPGLIKPDPAKMGEAESLIQDLLLCKVIGLFKDFLSLRNFSWKKSIWAKWRAKVGEFVFKPLEMKQESPRSSWAS